MKEKEVTKSIWEIHLNGQIITIDAEVEARKKFRSASSSESNNHPYLYRKDFDKKGKIIETYMVA